MAGFEPASSPGPKPGGVPDSPTSRLVDYSLPVHHFRRVKIPRQSTLLRLRWESNPPFRLPTCYRDRVVHQPLCAVTIFVEKTGIEPAN